MRIGFIEFAQSVAEEEPPVNMVDRVIFAQLRGRHDKAETTEYAVVPLGKGDFHKGGEHRKSHKIHNRVEQSAGEGDRQHRHGKHHEDRRQHIEGNHHANAQELGVKRHEEGAAHDKEGEYARRRPRQAGSGKIQPERAGGMGRCVIEIAGFGGTGEARQ